MLISTFGMSKKRAAIVWVLIIAGCSAVIAGTYYYFDSRNNITFNNPGEVIDEGELLAPERTEKVTNFETESVDVILAKEISDIEKVVELTNAASLSISVENYVKALPYQEAAYDLGAGEQSSRDILAYEIILVSREIGDQAKVDKYIAILGTEKFNQFDTPVNKDDEKE
jgi:hypothetical protein